MPLKLFDDLRDGRSIKEEVLKNQARFKLDLSGTKTGGKKLPNQKDVIKKVAAFFHLKEKNH